MSRYLFKNNEAKQLFDGLIKSNINGSASNDKALSILKSVYEKEPGITDPYFCYLYGECLYNSDQKNDAKNWFNKAYQNGNKQEYFKENLPIWHIINKRLGEYFFQIERYEDSKMHFEEALKFSIKDVESSDAIKELIRRCDFIIDQYKKIGITKGMNSKDKIARLQVATNELKVKDEQRELLYKLFKMAWVILWVAVVIFIIRSCVR